MTRTVGRYELLETIGHGGMGAVYKAFDPLLRRVVAVKLISASLDARPAMRERFFREARAAGQLSHRNIIVIYDLGEEQGQPFIAMEYLTGASLEHRVTGGGRLSVARAVDIMIDVCQGLEYAHARGVVHRDVKPGNLFVTESDEVKILDFGLAHLVSSELTRSETIMGTANYMSPEQVRGERVDRRADIFAAGVVLYELLAGRKAFEGDSFANTLFKVLESVPDPLHNYDPTIPLPLAAVVERALAKRREDRHQTAAEMLHELTVCREALKPGHRYPPVLTETPTAIPQQAPLTTGVDTAPSAPARDSSPARQRGRDSGMPLGIPPAGPGPRSVAWSPRRVRTTAVGGGLIAIAGATILLGPAIREFRDSPPAQQTAEQATQAPASQDAGARVVAPAPPAAEPPPVATPPADVTPPPAARAETSRPPAPSPRTRPAAEPAPVRSTRSVNERAQADGTIARLALARKLADASGADSLAGSQYREAIAAEGEVRGLYAAGEFSRATRRAEEAERLFLAAESAARTKRAADEAAKAEAAKAEAAKAEAAKAEAAKAEAAKAEAAKAEAAKAEAAKAEAARPAPVPAAPTQAAVEPAQPPAPEPARPAPAQPAPPDRARAAEAVQTVLDQYVAALESRSVAALRQLWPSLGGSQERAIRAEFENARSIDVRMTDTRIAVDGDGATITAMRQYQLLTSDGHRLATTSRMSMKLRRNGAGWVIDSVMYQ